MLASMRARSSSFTQAMDRIQEVLMMQEDEVTRRDVLSIFPRNVCRFLLLAVGLMVVAEVAGCAGHRNHPMMDIERGLCAHNQCARPKIKITKTQLSVVSFKGSGVIATLTAGSDYLRVTGEHVDREIQQLLVA